MLVGTTPLLDYWIATRPIPGQSESGDQYLVAPFPDGVLVAAVDGLGHGEQAAVAARTATAVLAEHADEPVVALVQRCHAALKRTRGAVMSIASCRAADNSITWLGIGNVEGALLRAHEPHASKPIGLLLRGGIVGDRLPTLLPTTLPLHCGDLLVFATDGIYSAFLRDLYFTEQPHELVHRVFVEYGRNTDDALLLGARWKNGDVTSGGTAS